MENASFVLLNIGSARHDGDWNYDQIRSPFARLYLVTDGRAEVKTGSEWHILEAGNLYLLPPFALHSDRCSAHFELIYLHFYETDAGLPGIFDRFEMPFDRKATLLDEDLFARLLAINPDRELKRYDPRWYDNAQMLKLNLEESARAPLGVLLETGGILCQLLSRFLSGATARFTPADPRIVRSIEYIHAHLDQHPEVHLLAASCFLSTDHFIRLFRKETGQTPQAYINSKRIEKAQTKLIFTTEPVKSIALQLSFGNASYFNRLFRRETGQTPLQYRNSHSNQAFTVEE